MPQRNTPYDEYHDEEVIMQYLEKSPTASTREKKLKARRRIEEMRDDKRLRRELDNYYYD